MFNSKKTFTIEMQAMWKRNRGGEHSKIGTNWNWRPAQMKWMQCSFQRHNNNKMTRIREFVSKCVVLLSLSAVQVIATPELFMDWEGQRMLSISSERCQVFVDRWGFYISSKKVSVLLLFHSILHGKIKKNAWKWNFARTKFFSNEISYMMQRGSIRHIGAQEMGFMINACSMMNKPIQNRPTFFIYPGKKTQIFGKNIMMKWCLFLQKQI